MGIIKVILVLAAVFTIIMGLFYIYDRIFPNEPDPQPEPITPKVVGISTLSKPFDFSQTKIIELKPIKDEMYKNSTNVVCYIFHNSYNADIKQNFSLVGEWFFDNSILPTKEYNKNLSYKEVINTWRINWIPVSNIDKIRFRTVLINKNKKSVSDKIGYTLLDKPELYDFLNIDNLIEWNNEILEDFTKKVSLCDNPTDKELAIKTLEFVREYMSTPPKTTEIIHYNNITLSSKEAWDIKLGTSSEYSVVYVMLLRAIGIPSKILTNPLEIGKYYFVEIYLKDKGWIPVDVYNKDSNVGEYLKFNKFKIGKQYRDFIIESFDGFEFLKFNIKNPYDKFYLLEGKIRNKLEKQFKTFQIRTKINLYNKTDNLIYSEETFLLKPFSEPIQFNQILNISTFIRINKSDEVSYLNLTKID